VCSVVSSSAPLEIPRVLALLVVFAAHIWLLGAISWVGWVDDRSFVPGKVVVGSGSQWQSSGSGSGSGSDGVVCGLCVICMVVVVVWFG